MVCVSRALTGFSRAPGGVTDPTGNTEAITAVKGTNPVAGVEMLRILSLSLSLCLSLSLSLSLSLPLAASSLHRSPAPSDPLQISRVRRLHAPLVNFLSASSLPLLFVFNCRVHPACFLVSRSVGSEPTKDRLFFFFSCLISSVKMEAFLLLTAISS